VRTTIINGTITYDEGTLTWGAAADIGRDADRAATALCDRARI
jgi:hypothetical protein